MDKVFVVLHTDGALTVWAWRQQQDNHAEGARQFVFDESVRMAELLEWVARGSETFWAAGAIELADWE